jgi:glycosyltransferase involved in cell wall biosynthesis
MGGAEKQALAVAESMARRGHDVALVVLMPPVREEWSTALRKIHLGISRSPTSWIGGMFRAQQSVRDFQPDLIHSHSYHANIAARLLKLAIPRAVIFSTVHNVYEGGWCRMLVYRLTDGLSRRTVAVSEAAAERFVRLRAIPVRKSSVITNGIDLGEFAPDARRREELRAHKGFGAESGDFVWIAVGRIATAKDYSNLLRAFAKVRSACHSALLWIAGEGTEHDFSVLRQLAAELRVSDATRWLGLRRDVPALLDAADGFVLSSAWEGMPLALGEAMAMEKPVVATDVGGVRELVGDAGALVPARDHERLAKAMIEVMQRSPGERSSLGGAARQRIVHHFSTDSTVDRWEALYSEVLTPRGAIPD